MSNLEEQVGEERERGKAAEQRIGRLSKEVWQKEEERAAAERTVAEKAGQREAAEVRVKSLETQVEEQANRVRDWVMVGKEVCTQNGASDCEKGLVECFLNVPQAIWSILRAFKLKLLH